jgi:uncharacterized repeat protein (TIGR04138 family)
MQEVSFEEALAQIHAKDPRYTRDAYLFVREALDHTQKAVAKSARRVRHVSGQELLEGIREFGLQQFGPMTKTLLDEWGVHCCQDFGEIVFNMIEVGWLAKTEKDSRADFSEGYDFDAAFVKPYLPMSKQTMPVREPKPAQSPKAKS